MLIRCGFGVRAAIRKRDLGVCSRCGRDCIATRRRIRRFLVGPRLRGRATRRIRLAKRILGLSSSELIRDLWQAHHVHAVAAGGGGCGLENYETLCVWCHRALHGKDLGNGAL